MHFSETLKKPILKIKGGAKQYLMGKKFNGGTLLTVIVGGYNKQGVGYFDHNRGS